MNYVIMRANAIAGTLLLATFSSLAVTLGPVRGAALVGRALDLTVPARLDAADDAAALCAEAEVAYSDTRIDARKVTVSTTPGAEARQLLIRVTSSAIVDEPVVSLSLRAGCAVKNSRRYVLLADLPVDAAERPIPLVPPLSAAAGVAGGVPGRTGPSQSALSNQGGSGMAGGAPVAGAGAADVRPTPRVPRPRAITPARPANNRLDGAAPQPAGGTSLSQSLRLGESAQRSAGTPRLRLDSADLPAETSPNLKSSAELQAVPAESDPRRSEFAAVWRALNLRTEEVSREMQRLDELQAQARGLREANTKSQADLGITREQLKKAEGERYANPLVYSLLALVAALLLGAGYLYYRVNGSRSGAAWWDLREQEHKFEPEPMRQDTVAVLPDPFPVETAAMRPSRLATVAEPQRRAVQPEDSFQPGFRNGESTYPPSGSSASSRGVNVNELFDIAQQADFFVSLGQHDHAIEVLANHIRENVQTSPLAYLDLFKLYHDLDREPQYNELRVEFNRLFNAEIPPFQSFRQRGEGLEAYENAITRIQSLWNTPRVLDVIEESIFRKPGGSADAFGLEAYRELLLLYAMANELLGSARAPGSGGMSGQLASSSSYGHDETSAYSSTELQPLVASAVFGPNDDTTPGKLVSRTAARNGGVGLDVDLSDPWLGVESSVSDDTVVLPPNKPEAFQPASSAWLDFDLSDYGADEPEARRVNKDTPNTPRT